MDIGNLLKLSATVATAFATGGASAGVLIPAGLGIAAEFFKDDEKDDPELKWARSKIGGWSEVYKKLMDIPMRPEVKKETAMAMIRGDYAKKFAQKPKERWVEQMHALMVMGVKGELVVEGLR